MFDMAIFNAVQCERGVETTRLKMSQMVRFVLDTSIAKSSLSYHIKITLCSCNVGLMRGRSNEVVELMSRRKVDICGLQEVRWKVASARLVEGKDSRYKMFWVVNGKGMGGVETLLAEKLVEAIFNKSSSAAVLAALWTSYGHMDRC